MILNMNEQATLDTPVIPNFKMSTEQIVKLLQGYLAQADTSLTSLQSNIDDATNKLNEWKRMQLIIVGQKQLIQDILSKTVDTPKEETK